MPEPAAAMTFWRDNRLDQEHEVPHDLATAEFWASTDAADWLEHGGRFERTLLAWLATTYGTWDPEAQRADYEALYDAIWAARPKAGT